MRTFTLGIEEEFQTVDAQTGQLLSCIHPILEKVYPVFGKTVRTELIQATLELASAIYPDIQVARRDLYYQRARLAQLVGELGIALISAGTHPGALWQEQKRTEGAAYALQEKEEQDIGRSLLIFGLHIHIGLEDRDLAISVMNCLRTWLPHLLALATNSPFWAGRFTGLRSYRAALWGQCPRSGIPPLISSWKDFETYIQRLVNMQCIRDGRGVWWDIRPHSYFQTIEMRIFDMPATVEDTLALAALCQALVARLCWLAQHGKAPAVLPGEYIEENKWRAMRYGLDAQVADFEKTRLLSMRNALHELLNSVEEVVDDLGSHREMQYLRALIDSPQGTGANRQIAIYQETGNIQDVTRLLMRLTLQGVPPTGPGSAA